MSVRQSRKSNRSFDLQLQYQSLRSSVIDAPVKTASFTDSLIAETDRQAGNRQKGGLTRRVIDSDSKQWFRNSSTLDSGATE